MSDQERKFFFIRDDAFGENIMERMLASIGLIIDPDNLELMDGDTVISQWGNVCLLENFMQYVLITHMIVIT